MAVALQLISTIALIATLGAVIVYTVKTADLADATHDMARSGAEQLSAFRQQFYEDRRPLLVPSGSPAFQTEHPNWLDWHVQVQEMDLRNIGPGPALNVASVLYGCESYLVGDNPGTQARVSDQQDEHWTCWLGRPITPGTAEPVAYPKGASIFRGEHKLIGAHHFNAPPEPTFQALMLNRGSMHSARVVTTCTDIFGHKHASIFDYVPHERGWRLIEFIPDIAEDLHDMNEPL